MRWIAKYRKQRMGALAAAIAVTAWMPMAMAEVEGLPDEATGNNALRENVESITYETVKTKNDTMKVVINNDRAAINWNTFNIANGKTVEFSRTNNGTGWAVLNRVTGGTSSAIDGNLIGHGGTVFLINPNGITFGSTACVEVGSLVASTLEMKEDFLAKNDNGHYVNRDFTFEGKGGSDGGAIRILSAANNVSATDINANGVVALLAKQVENNGTIKAGKAYVAAGNKIQVKYDDKISVEVPGSASANDSIINTGNINDGTGYVLMTAKAAVNLLSDTVNAKPTVKADKIIIDKDGNVELTGDKVLIDGKITSNGSITTTGTNALQVNDSADIHAKTWNINAKNVDVVKGVKTPEKLDNLENDVSSKVISAALKDTNVNITASPNDPTYYADINIKNKITKTEGGNTELTFTAGRNISVDADITSTEGALNLTLNSRNMEKTNSKREDGANIIRADISTNGGNFTTTGKHGTYFGVILNSKDGSNIGATRDIKTEGGNISLLGDEVLVATGGVVNLNAGETGNVFIEGKVNSANAYYNVENAGTLSWAKAREGAKNTEVDALKGKTHLAVITSALEDAVATSTIAKSNATTKEAFVGGHVLKVKTKDGYPVDAEGNLIIYATDDDGNPVIKGTPVIDDGSVTKDESGNITGITVMAATDNKGWYKIKDKDGTEHYARFWGWTEGAEAGNIFYVQTTGETVLDSDMESSTNEAWVHNNHGAAVYNAKDSSEAYVNFAPKEPNDDKGQDKTNGTQMALAINYDTHLDGKRKEILYSQWDDIGASATQIKNYVVEAELGKTALNIDGKDVKLSGAVGNLTQLKDVSVNAFGNIDVQGTVNVENKVKLAGKDIMIGGNITADAQKADDAVVIQAQGNFLNPHKAAISMGDLSSWKIYSDNPKDDDFGGLNSESFAFWGWDGKNTYSSDRNLYIFKYNPTLTITANDATKKFGEALSDTGYTLKNELSGQYLNNFLDGYDDMLKTAYMLNNIGTKSYGYPVSAPLGIYRIDLTNTDNGVAALRGNGYKVYVNPGTLTVTGDNPDDVKPQLDPHNSTNLDGSASYTTAPRQAGPGADRVLGLQSAELPFFREENGQTKLYGTYDVSIDPDKVKMEPTAKILPEPDQPKNQYREYDKELTTQAGTAKFKMTYNGSTFDIYPVDNFAKDLLVAGDAAKNVDVESQALFAAFKEMGITLDDLDGVYTHFDSKK
ncbi:two-partner secretion domain-containing protein [Selenomonas ruminantium]|uniref:Filamentous hemagglutinin family N-terminal domain-containing protein n=1 Tax=Selenomonas ruminantium TaxID=971 RepID=A0A1H3Y6M3_SELRU|nr:filamentous hemagglutinin N-terminal domain-containing protein [Selenomonas ruminantium]SEA06492.1 filamentous hemagglutinin family N-terminal domain-containing protein [Selenomonas ruminantium]